MGGTEKRGEQTKILKRGQAVSRGGCLRKGGGAGIPLPTKSIIKGKHEGKCDHKSVIRPWLEWRNQQKQSSKIVL